MCAGVALVTEAELSLGPLPGIKGNGSGRSEAENQKCDV